jgi:hypothetical protein
MVSRLSSCGVSKSSPFAGASFSKHLLKPSQNRRYGLRRESAERADQALGVDRTELVQRHIAGAALKAARYSPWVCTPPVVIGATITVRRYWFRSSGK